MSAVATRLDAQARTPPAEWALLPPYDGEAGTLWQAWARERGPGYWLMRYATRLANHINRVEGVLRRRPFQRITNNNALEDGGTYQTRGEAEDYCRIVRRDTQGRKRATISPVIVGRAYSVERVQAAGDFDPFKTFDFSATEAVKEQARHVLVSVDTLNEITAALTNARNRARPAV